MTSKEIRTRLKEHDKRITLVCRKGQWIARLPATYRHLDTHMRTLTYYCKSIGLTGEIRKYEGRDRHGYAAVWAEFWIQF